MKKVNYTTLLFIAFAFFFVSTLVLLYLNYFVKKPEIITNQVPTPTKTFSPPSLQTYNNEQYSFEFQYPATYSILKDNSFVDTPVVMLTNVSSTSKLNQLPDIFVRHIKIIPPQTLPQALTEDVIMDGSGMHPKFSNFKKITIGSQSYYYIETGLFEGIFNASYYLVNQQDVFVFSLSSSPVPWTDPNFETQIDPVNVDLNQILSTFKFL